MRRSGALSASTCVLVTALAATGCLERTGATVGPEIGFGQSVSIDNLGVTSVDLLFVIDDSGSMAQEQTNLSTQIPALVRDLASPPDRDADGAPDWNAVESLRIGIVTTDVGTGSVQYPRSMCVPGGDGGAFQGGGLFEWSTGDDPDAFAASVRDTVVALGTTGCAFEQQLESGALALTNARPNGFPREDALLGVIVVTDEDDCSVEDDDAFFSTLTDTEPNVHCTRNADLLTPLSDLLADLRGDRSDDEIVFAAITGVPMDLPIEATAQQILAHPLMQYEEVLEGANNPVPRPVCEFTDDTGESLGKAAPARRLVELAAMLPGSVVTTICTDDFGPAISAIAERIGSRIPGVCLARALPDGVGGQVPCDATVRLPAGESCDAHPGYSLREIDGDGRAVCELAQIAPGSGESGFYYDATNDACPQLALTEDARPPLGAELDAECFFQLLLDMGEQCARGSQCESGYCDPVDDACAPLPESGGPTG